jgi:hypothetical protein
MHGGMAPSLPGMHFVQRNFPTPSLAWGNLGQAWLPHETASEGARAGNGARDYNRNREQIPPVRRLARAERVG